LRKERDSSNVYSWWQEKFILISSVFISREKIMEIIAGKINKYIACKSRKTTHKFNGKNNIKIMACMATTQGFNP